MLRKEEHFRTVRNRSLYWNFKITVENKFFVVKIKNFKKKIDNFLVLLKEKCWKSSNCMQKIVMVFLAQILLKLIDQISAYCSSWFSRKTRTLSWLGSKTVKKTRKVIDPKNGSSTTCTVWACFDLQTAGFTKTATFLVGTDWIIAPLFFIEIFLDHQQNELFLWYKIADFVSCKRRFRSMIPAFLPIGFWFFYYWVYSFL